MIILSFTLLMSFRCALCEEETIDVDTENIHLRINSCNIIGEITSQNVIINNQLWESNITRYDIPVNQCFWKSINSKFQFTGQNGVKLVLNGSFQLKTEMKVGGGPTNYKKDKDNFSRYYVGGFTFDPKTCTSSTENFNCPKGVGPGAGPDGAMNGFNEDGMSIWGEDYGNGEISIGGSVGPQVDPSGFAGNGGGVLILVVNGNLSIKANISANGYENQDDLYCSGGSAGGFIMIKANEIMISNKSSIHANGGSSGRDQDSANCKNGGAGGIVSLNALIFIGNFQSLVSVNGGKGKENGLNGKIILQTLFKTDLNINTTSCVLKSSDYPNMSFYGKTIATDNFLIHKCEFTFQHSVKILKNVKIHLSGKSCLAIIIKDGGMEVHTTLNLLKNFNTTEDTFLGGFHNNKPYRGLGANFNSSCHGSRLSPDAKNSNPCYGINPWSLVGGSSCKGAIEGLAVGGGSIEIVIEHGNLSLFASIEADAFVSKENSDCKSSGGTIWIQADYVHFKTNHSSLSVLGSKNGGEGGIIRVIGKLESDVVNSSSVQKYHIKVGTNEKHLLKGDFIAFDTLASFNASLSQRSNLIQTKSVSTSEKATANSDISMASTTLETGNTIATTEITATTTMTPTTISITTMTETTIETTTMTYTKSTSISFTGGGENTTARVTAGATDTTKTTTGITTKTFTISPKTPITITTNSTPVMNSTVKTVPTLKIVEPKAEVINSTSLNSNNFEPFVNAVLSVAKNDQTDKTSTALIDAVKKVATYPYDYKNFEAISNVVAKIAESCDYVISSLVKSSADGVEGKTGSLAASLESISLKMGNFLNESLKNFELKIGKIYLEVALFNKTEPIKSMPESCRKKYCDKVEISSDILESSTSATAVSATAVTIVSIDLNQNVDQSIIGEQKIYKSKSWHAVSSIFSVSVNNTVLPPFLKPVVLRQRFSVSTNQPYKLLPGYWNNKPGSAVGWAFDGLMIINISENEVIVHSNHLTTFAILMQVTEFDIGKNHKLTLSWISYIGCGLSLFGYLITFAVLFSIRSLSTERLLIHLNLAISLAIAQTVFLLGITATANKNLCTFIAVLLHYFFTASFGWMLCEGIHLYVKVVSVYNNWTKMAFYHCIGWGIPIIIVSISAAIESKGYGTKSHCWISTEDGLIWAFVGPVLFVILVNVVVMVVVIKILVASLNDPIGISMVELKQQIRASLKAMVILMPILGLSWLFGIFAVNKKAVVYQYIFTTLSSTQGVFIFLLHCVGNTEVRSALKRLHSRRLHSKMSKRRFSLLEAVAESLRGLFFRQSKVYCVNSSRITKLSSIQTVNSSAFESLNNIEFKYTDNENHSINNNDDS